jgi:hypothetical protein
MRRDRLAHLGGRAHRAQRVVLVRDRDAEDGHHRVPTNFSTLAPCRYASRGVARVVSDVSVLCPRPGF